MGLGILPDHYLGDDVPGTSRFDDLHDLTPQTHLPVESSNLKRSNNGVVLIPQPSSSPDDPLNWPRWRKMMLMVTITYSAGVVGSFTTIISAGFPDVSASLHAPIDSLTMMAGDMTLATGLVLIIGAPLIVIFGRRPVFLIASALLLASTIWSARAKNVGNLIASRIIGAIGGAPTECLAEVIIADVFFVHERATWIALWNLAMLGGFCGVNIANGYLIQYVSWRICFLIEAGLCGILFILTFFFFPETAFVRESVRIPSETETIIETEQKLKDEVDEVFDKENTRKISYWRSLSPCAGRRFSNERFWKTAVRPFALLCSPVVVWATLLYGSALAWTAVLSIAISLLFSSPEFGYNLPAGPVGLIGGIGPLIAGILGNALAGPVSDRSVAWLSRRNGGVYEPEFRLFMIIPMLISMTIGWYGWAISSHFRAFWIAPVIFYSMIYFGLAVGSVGIFSYVVDAHGENAAESFAAINLCKNLFIFALSYVIVPWLENQGVLLTFCEIGGINIFFCLLTVPMYIYGKRARSWVHRTPWMRLK